MTTLQSLSTLSASELDACFRSAHAGPIPEGRGIGQALVLPGTWLEPWLERAIFEVAWKGKVFDASEGTLRNLITPLGVQAIAADVYQANSRFDGKPCIVLDYSRRSLIARPVRDELRHLGGGLYLGRACIASTRVLHFTLQFQEPSSAGAEATAA